MACQGCDFCCLCFVLPACCFSVFLLSVYVYCRLGIICVYPPLPTHTHFSPVATTCVHFLASYFSIDFWMYFWRIFLDVATFWTPCSHRFPLFRHHFFILFRTSIFNSFWKGFDIIFDVLLIHFPFAHATC